MFARPLIRCSFALMSADCLEDKGIYSSLQGTFDYKMERKETLLIALPA